VQSLFIRKGIKMRRPYLIFVLLVIIVTVFQGASAAQIGKRPAGRIVVCMIQLEHADAEQLAAVLRPFLSPDGSLSPYTPTNTLIIRDRQPVVNMLSEAIKGRPCTPSAQSPGD
jgi:type II secretory pathway component GspD/PulD (secretin)